MQLFNEEEDAPQPELPVTVQLFNVLPAAPPPQMIAELPVNVQLLSVQSAAPPPSIDTLPERVQLLSVLPLAPPPEPLERLE